MSITHRPRWDLPLDTSLYAPDEEEKAFLKTTTGIQDDEELKAHILGIQTKAFTVREWLSRQCVVSVSHRGPQIYKYPCIRQFDFMKYVQRLPF